MVGQDCNFNIFGVDAGGPVVEDYPWVLTKAQVILAYMRPYLKNYLFNQLILSNFNASVERRNDSYSFTPTICQGLYSNV